MSQTNREKARRIFDQFAAQLSRLRKTQVFEGYGLQAVCNRSRFSTALAAEGKDFDLKPSFSAASLAVLFQDRLLTQAV
jgi:hypothetical protein